MCNEYQLLLPLLLLTITPTIAVGATLAPTRIITATPTTVTTDMITSALPLPLLHACICFLLSVASVFCCFCFVFFLVTSVFTLIPTFSFYSLEV